jgi:hypothetical protein
MFLIFRNNILGFNRRKIHIWHLIFFVFVPKLFHEIDYRPSLRTHSSGSAFFSWMQSSWPGIGIGLLYKIYKSLNQYYHYIGLIAITITLELLEDCFMFWNVPGYLHSLLQFFNKVTVLCVENSVFVVKQKFLAVF